MLAAVFKGDGIVQVEERPVPKCKEENDVLLEVVSCGFCGSDLQALSIPPGQSYRKGVIMGHEIYGRVLERGSAVYHVAIGDYVAVDPVPKCGVCDFCKNGQPNYCLNWKSHHYGQQLDGGFAKYVLVKAECLYKFKSRVSKEAGAQTEPLACVLNGIKKVAPSPLDNVVLYGAGPIGLLFLRCLLLFGVQNLIVCETSRIRREYAQRCGAKYVIDADDRVEEKMLALWSERASVVIDTVGIGPTVESGMPLLCPGGKYLIFGQNSNAEATIRPAFINTNEIQVFGSFIGKHTSSDAVKLLGLDGFSAEKLVSHIFPVSEIQQAVDLAKSKTSARIVIVPD